jgi:hypothetical protein
VSGHRGEVHLATPTLPNSPTYRASPCLDEHNFDVYPQLLGLDESEVGERMGHGLFR